MPGKIPAHLSKRIVQLGVEAMASCPCRSSKRVWGRYQLNWQHFLQVEGRLAVPGRSLLNVSQRITTIHQARVGSRIHWKDGGCSWHGSQWQCAISASLCMAVQASQFWHFTFVLHSLLLHIAIRSPRSEADYSEFIAGCLDAHTDLIESALSHVFHVFDINGDGKISLKELSSILTADGSLSLVLPEGKTVEEFMKDSWPNWAMNHEGLAFLSPQSAVSS